MKPAPQPALALARSLRGALLRWPSPVRLDAMLPSLCPICRRWNGSVREGGTNKGANSCGTSSKPHAGWPLCRSCLAQYAQPALRCMRCALALGPPSRLGTEQEDKPRPAPRSPRLCGACLHDPPAWAQACCAVDYSFPWAQLVAALKFQGRPELAKPLGQMLAAASFRAAHEASMPLADWVLPMPLSARRLRERGYNQAWELARHCAKPLKLRTLPHGLHRSLDAPAQAGLSRAQRARNLRAAFHVPLDARAQIQGCRVALVDDVLTTGATAREASLALLRAGAAQVQVWAFARTPEPLSAQAL